MSKSFLLVLIAVATIAGCKSSTSPGAPGTLFTPNAGSYFISVTTTTDSNGIVVSLDTTMTLILQTNISIYGKTGVMASLDSDAGGWATDTDYSYYESNGDRGEYQGSSNSWPPSPAGWAIFPFASQKTTTLLNIVASFDPDTSSHIVETVSGGGSGSVTVNGTAIGVQKINLTIAETDTTLPARTTYSTNNITTVWFAPSLGSAVETDNPGIRESAGAALDNSVHTQLIDFVLK